MLSTYVHGPGPPQMGPGPLHATRTPRIWVWDLHVPPGPPQMGPGPPRAYPDPLSPRLSSPLRRGPEPPRVTQTRVRAQAFRWKLAHVSRMCGRGHKPSAGSSLTHPH